VRHQVPLSARLVCEAAGGHVVAGDPDRTFVAVSTDTRTIGDGALFIALQGERFDGHAFVGAAVSGGATGVVVSSMPVDAAGATVIVVADTLVALQQLARTIRRRAGTTVIAITGSAGKTTTKEVTADLLGLCYRVFRNRGNLNNHIGLPLSLVELRHGPDLAVVELGMNHAGEIRTLVGLAEPDVRVWTNVGDAHIGHFGSREEVARAKAEVLELATAETLVVANADDPLVMAHVEGFVGRRLTFGESAHASVRATEVSDRGFDGVSAVVVTPAGPVALSVPLPGRAHLMNVLAAIAVAVHFDVPLDAIANRVATLRPVARRGLSVVSPRGIRVVDDSYNASPAAVQAALRALAATPTTGRRVAVLGEMLELGSETIASHAACGRTAATCVQQLIVVGGPAAEALAAAAIDAGLPAAAVHRVADSAEAAALAPSIVESGDLVLVKGSRGVRTDLVADRLGAAA